MKHNLVKVLKFLIYSSFFVPLVVLPTSFIFPFIVPKILIFRSLVILMLACYTLLLVINWNEFKPRFSLLNLALAAFFASFAVSTFTGVDPYHSFWDNHERMLGLFTIFHYIAYYFICSSVLKSWDDWKTALKVFLVAGSAAMFVGLLQVGNPNLLLNQGSARVASTLGNPIYVGGYGLFLIFVAFLLLVREKNPLWKWIEGGLAVLAILGMFYSGTRGSMLGFFVGIGVLIVGYAIVLKEHPQVRRYLWIAAAMCVVLLGVLYFYRTTKFVSGIPAIGRVLNTSFQQDIENSPRLIAWKIAYTSWKVKPVFGWGPNNFFYVFNQFYNPKSLEHGYGETWFDNAHNIIMNTLAVQGAFGLLSYLSIFLMGILSLVFARRQKRISPHLLVVGAAFLVAHLVQNITVFENPTSYLYFMFWLAMINRLSFPSYPEEENNKMLNQKNFGQKLPTAKPDKQVGSGLVYTFGAVAFIFIFIFNIQPARANMMTLGALKMLTVQPLSSLDSVKAALAFNSPHIDDIRSDIGRTASQILNNPQIDKAKATEIFNVVYQALQENLKLHPLDIRNQLTLSQLAQEGYAFTGNADYIFQYGAYLNDALKYSPRRQQLIYNLSNYYLQLGQGDEAVKLLAQSIEDDIKIAEGYWRLAYVYKITGKTDKANEVLDLAKKNGIVFNVNDQNIINQIMQIVPEVSTTIKK